MRLTKENKVFNLFSERIEISEGRNIYNSLKLEYDNKVLEAQDKFRKVYINENKSIDDVIKNSLNQGQEIIIEYISEVVSYIVDMGFYNIDEEVFYDKYYNKYDLYYECYEEIKDRYMDIVLNEEEKDEYRRRRKENRSRWQGGGFGIGGAIKGATQAGMMNIASGAVHGAYNTAGKICSSIGTSLEKGKLFNDKNTLQILSDGVGASIYGIHLAFICFLDENTDYNVDIISNDDEKEAEVILKNILCKKIDIKIELQLLKRIIELDPYNTDVYKYILKKYGDKNLEVELIARYFGYDLRKFKEEMIDEKYKTLRVKTQKDVINSKKILLDELSKLGLKKEHSKLEIINKKIDEFNKTEKVDKKERKEKTLNNDIISLSVKDKMLKMTENKDNEIEKRNTLLIDNNIEDVYSILKNLGSISESDNLSINIDKNNSNNLKCESIDMMWKEQSINTPKEKEGLNNVIIKKNTFKSDKNNGKIEDKNKIYNKKNKIEKQRGHLFASRASKIIYYLILALFLLITFSNVGELFLFGVTFFIIPILFIGVIFGMFGRIKILHGKKFIYKLGITATFLFINLIFIIFFIL